MEDIQYCTHCGEHLPEYFEDGVDKFYDREGNIMCLQCYVEFCND